MSEDGRVKVVDVVSIKGVICAKEVAMVNGKPQVTYRSATSEEAKRFKPERGRRRR